MASDAPKTSPQLAALVEALDAADRAYIKALGAMMPLLAHPFRHGLRVTMLGVKMVVAYCFCLTANRVARILVFVQVHEAKVRAARESTKDTPPG